MHELTKNLMMIGNAVSVFDSVSLSLFLSVCIPLFVSFCLSVCLPLSVSVPSLQISLSPHPLPPVPNPACVCKLHSYKQSH